MNGQNFSNGILFINGDKTQKLLKIYWKLKQVQNLKKAQLYIILKKNF